jgi:putative peptidoglycan lipid II flippase
MNPAPDAPTMFDLPVITDPIPGGEPSRGTQTMVQPAVSDEGGGGLLRSSAMMSLGTIASRGTGFIRTAIIVIALGTGALGDAYNTANTIPNIVYDLLLGGILTAVHVPLLVRSRERGAKYAEEFEQRLFTMLVGVLLALTAIAMVAAPLLIDLYASSFTPSQHRLAVIFAMFFLPQIFFYGFGAVAGASLNSRGRFAAPMWTPVLNNIVVSIVALAFLLIAGAGTKPENITSGETTLLALGTTAGVAIQAIALVPSLRKIGFKWRPRLDFQPGELRSMGNVGGWTLFYVGIQQVGMLVNTNLANAAGARGEKELLGYGVGYTVFTNAYLLFQLPFAIVTVSVMTAMLPKMSRHAAERRYDLVRESLSSGLRLSSVVVVPAAALLFALAAEISTLFFNHGATSLPDALMIANVVQAFALVLVPFMVLQLLQRGFYALADTRTPALISILTIAISIGLATIGFETLPTNMIVEGIAISLGVSWAVGAVITAIMLGKRLGGLGGGAIVQTHVKILVATVPALILALLVHVGFKSMLGQNTIASILALAVGGGGGGALYFLVARRLHIPEVESLYRTVITRLPGRVSG